MATKYISDIKIKNIKVRDAIVLNTPLNRQISMCEIKGFLSPSDLSPGAIERFQKILNEWLP